MLTQSSLSSMITIESHSKQVKLLNEYILSLEKKLKEVGEGVRQPSLADDLRRLTQENNKLRNENNHLRYTVFKQEESIKRLAIIQAEVGRAQTQWQTQRMEWQRERSQLVSQIERLGQHLTTCEHHLRIAQNQITNRSATFKAELDSLSVAAGQFKTDLQHKVGECQSLILQKNGLQVRLQETERKLLDLQSSTSQTIRVKQETIVKLKKNLEQLHLKFSNQTASINASQNSYGEQVRELVRLLNESRNQVVVVKREASEARRKADGYGKELDAIVVKLNSRNQDYQNLCRSSNEEKNILTRMVKQLQEDKKVLETLNGATKADVAQKMRIQSELVKQCEGLEREKKEIMAKLEGISKQLAGAALVKQEQDIRENRLVNEVSRLKLTQIEAEQAWKKIGDSQNLLREQLQFKLKERIEALQVAERTIDQHKKMIVGLNHRVQQINGQLLESRQKEISGLQYYIQKINGLNDEVMKYQKQIATLNGNLTALNLEYDSYKKQKNLEVQSLNERVKDVYNESSSLRGNSDSLSREYSNYRNIKQAQIIGLNSRVQQLMKQQVFAQQNLQKVRQEYVIFQRRKELQIQDLNMRLRDVLKEQVTLKDTLDNTTRQYYTFQKKSQADIYSLNQRWKENVRALEKKEGLIQELREELKNLEKGGNNKENLNISLRLQIQQLQARIQKEGLQHQRTLNEVTIRNEQLIKQRQVVSMQIEQLEGQVRALRQEGRGKEKLNELYKAIQSQRDQLLQQVKSLSLNTLMVNQSKTSREVEMEVLRRSISGLQEYVTQQKLNIEGLNRLLAERQKEIEALENSNTTLRKQIISSIAGEQKSRKEILDSRDRACSTLAASRTRPKSTKRVAFSGFRSRASIEGSMNGTDVWPMRTNVERISNHGALSMKESLVRQMGLLSPKQGIKPQRGLIIDTQADQDLQ